MGITTTASSLVPSCFHAKELSIALVGVEVGFLEGASLSTYRKQELEVLDEVALPLHGHYTILANV